MNEDGKMVPIPCPDGKPGCLVAHYGPAPVCKHERVALCGPNSNDGKGFFIITLNLTCQQCGARLFDKKDGNHVAPYVWRIPSEETEWR